MIAVVAAMALVRDAGPPPRLIQSTLLPPQGWNFAPASPFAVSPDGSQIAYVAIATPDNAEAGPGSNALWIRDLAVAEPRQLARTDGDAYPFWSPDGRWLGFFADGKLNKIGAGGGPVIPLCEATEGRGGSWSDSGVIIFQRSWSEGLMQVSAGGGTPEPLTTLDKNRFEVAHRWPHFLPDGRNFLFYVVSTTNPLTSEHSGVYIGTLGSKETRLLLRSESRALYSRGHLLYRVASTLMAHPFDASKQLFTGDPAPLATDIPGGGISWGGAQFGTSEAGVLVHLRGAGATRTVLNWRDRSGGVSSAVGETATDIWIYDLERDSRTRFTFDPADDRTPLWSPDGGQVAFSSGRHAEGEIYRRPASGQGDDELLFTANAQIELMDWSRDGRLLFFNRVSPSDGDRDIWILDMQSLEATPFLTGRSEEGDPRLSPDGRWLAFVSDESGASEIYVQAFPEASGRWMVSSDGGGRAASRPVWRGDGRELYYLRGGKLVTVPVTGDATFSFGTPSTLFNVSVTSASANYTITPDGQRILTNELPPADPGKVGARLMLNWNAALAR